MPTMSDEHTPPIRPVQTKVRCPQCEYDLTGTAIGSPCPECGLLIDHAAMRAASELPTSGKAVAALVLGIVAVIGSIYAFISIPCGVISIFLYQRVKRQIIEREVSPSSESLAKAGMICGIVGIVLGGVGILILLFFAGLAFI